MRFRAQVPRLDFYYVCSPLVPCYLVGGNIVQGLCETIVIFFLLTIFPVKSYERALDCLMQAVLYWPVCSVMGKSLALSILSVHIHENDCLLSNRINTCEGFYQLLFFSPYRSCKFDRASRILEVEALQR